MSLIHVEGKEVVDLRGSLPVRKGAGRYPARPLEGITMVVIHYSGVDADSSALQIAKYQTTKGTGDLFPECAYTFVVRWDGRIEQCHDLEKRTWHAGGRNNDAGIGICLPGSEWPTEEQLGSASALIQAICRELGRSDVALLLAHARAAESGVQGAAPAGGVRGAPESQRSIGGGEVPPPGGTARPLLVAGHQELSATLCPGPHWSEWRLELVRQRDTGYEVILGFKQMYDYLGEERCGLPLSPERYDEHGNSSQLFSRCEMRWDRAENRVWVSLRTED